MFSGPDVIIIYSPHLYESGNPAFYRYGNIIILFLKVKYIDCAAGQLPELTPAARIAFHEKKAVQVSIWHGFGGNGCCGNFSL
jgi:hypothetical protein